MFFMLNRVRTLKRARWDQPRFLRVVRVGGDDRHSALQLIEPTRHQSVAYHFDFADFYFHYVYRLPNTEV